MLLRRLVGADLTRRALRRGVVGGEPLWRSLAVALVLGRVLRRALRRDPEVAATQRLGEGAALRISSSRRSRR